MILRIIAVAILMSVSLHSQPYYYYEKSNPNGDEKPGGYSIDIYRLNLATNNSEPFLIDAGRVNGPVYFNTDQSKIFFQVRFSLMVVDVNDASRQMHEVLSGANEIIEIKDSPAMNRYYVPLEDINGNRKTIILDRQSLQPIDTIYEKDTPYNSFLSQNEKSLFQLEDDSTGIYFSEYFIDQKQQGNPQRFGNVGPIHPNSLIYQHDTKMGYALISYVTAASTLNIPRTTPFTVYGEYVVCNVNENKIYVPIKDPWNSDGYLSPAANYVVVEQKSDDGEHKIGKITIFDAQTGKLMQRLSLPPEGKILLFDNYPDKLFYLTGTDGNFQSIQVSLNVITPVTTLIDTLIALTNQSHQQNLIGNSHFAHDLVKKLDEAKKHLTKKHADTKDSVKCAKEVKKFQKKVNEAYEETIEKEKKHEKQEKKFVTVEGWKFLYYNAQYILDRLPAPKKEEEEEDE